MPIVQRNECKAVLDEESTCPPKQRKPCSKCGALSRFYSEQIDEKAVVRDGLGMKARHKEDRRPFFESYVGPNYSKDLGKHIEKHRIIDRENDKYLEHIENYEPGDVIHHNIKWRPDPTRRFCSCLSV